MLLVTELHDFGSFWETTLGRGDRNSMQASHKAWDVWEWGTEVRRAGHSAKALQDVGWIWGEGALGQPVVCRVCWQGLQDRPHLTERLGVPSSHHRADSSELQLPGQLRGPGTTLETAVPGRGSVVNGV